MRAARNHPHNPGDCNNGIRPASTARKKASARQPEPTAEIDQFLVKKAGHDLVKKLLRINFYLKQVYKASMSRWSQSFPLILILIALISNVSVLVIKPVLAQSNTAPTVSIVFPTNNTVFNESFGTPIVSFQLTYETNNTLSWVGYSIDGGNNITVTGNNTYVERSLVNGGYHTLTLYANDTDGNWATPQTVTYLVNVLPDTTSVSSSPSAIDALIPLVTVFVIAYGVLAVVLVFLLFYRRHRKTN